MATPITIPFQNDERREGKGHKEGEDDEGGKEGLQLEEHEGNDPPQPNRVQKEVLALKKDKR